MRVRLLTLAGLAATLLVAVFGRTPLVGEALPCWWGCMPQVSGEQRWVTLLCAFPDRLDGLPKPADFSAYARSGSPGLQDYWNEVSYGAVHYTHLGTYGWFQLPHAQSYYLPNGTQGGFVPGTDLPGAALLNDDCIRAADPSVDFTRVDGMHLVFGGPLDGQSYGGEDWRDLDGVHRLFKGTHLAMTVNAPPSPAIVAHEIGHTFRLWHSSGPYGRMYDSGWDVMSSGSGPHPAGEPASGGFGVHTHAYNKIGLGWLGWDRVLEPGYGQTWRVNLQQLSRPGTDGPVVIFLPAVGQPGTIYAIEARTKVGYDAGIPAEGVLIMTIAERAEPIHIVDSDGNGDPNDAGAIWTPGEVFIDPAGGFRLTVRARTATGFEVEISRSGQQIRLAGVARD